MSIFFLNLGPFDIATLEKYLYAVLNMFHWRGLYNALIDIVPFGTIHLKSDHVVKYPLLQKPYFAHYDMRRSNDTTIDPYHW